MENPGAVLESALTARAHQTASTWAERAGVSVSELTTGDEFTAGSALLARVWGTSLDASPLPADLLASLAHAGSCVMGARAGADLVGLAVCLAGGPRSTRVYSVIAATASEVAGRGVGAALKFGQRAWSLDRGADRMVWTFDPLVRRNAHFNINKLGAHATTYLPDFYPPMHDAINRQDLTDRLVAEWVLGEPVAAPVDASGAVTMVGVGDSQQPIRRDPGEAERLSIDVPPDIERLRRSDPGLAREWRLAIRDALGSRLSNGFRIAGFARSGGYLLERGTHD